MASITKKKAEWIQRTKDDRNPFSPWDIMNRNAQEETKQKPTNIMIAEGNAKEDTNDGNNLLTCLFDAATAALRSVFEGDIKRIR
jgi:hypothetical protein